MEDWECGEIGRHDGLKIHCLVIGVRVQVPPFPRLKLDYSEDTDYSIPNRLNLILHNKIT